jgi:hypothetical protein
MPLSCTGPMTLKHKRCKSLWKQTVAAQEHDQALVAGGTPKRSPVEVVGRKRTPTESPGPQRERLAGARRHRQNLDAGRRRELPPRPAPCHNINYTI